MPSIAVQTSWSWLQDIAKIADYYQQIRVEDVTLHLSISPELVEQLNTEVRDEKQKSDELGSESPIGTDDCAKELYDDGVVSSSDPLTTIGVVNEHQQPDHLLSQQSYDDKLYDKNKANDSSAAVTTATGDDLTAGSAGTVEATAIEVKPSTIDTTMPLILKYSRESEEKPSDVQLCAITYDDMSSNESLLITCEFCGAEINPDFTPVCNKDNNDPCDSEEDDCGGYCCHDYKLFIELTTNYMQQMVEALQSEQAKRIDVKPGKKLVKKAAEEQAEARMKSRRLQDRRMRSDSGNLIDPIKILQSASFYTLSKQMKTINFSLSSPKYSTQGWVVRVSSGKHHQVTQQVNHRRRKRRDRASVQTTDSFLLPTITFRNDISNTKLSNKSAPIIKTYSNGNVFQVLLPDGTGHCQYPSGNLAIVNTVLYPGLLSYILYEDDPAGVLLGYFDQAGRACTYYRDHKIKLFFSHSIGKLFEPGGKVRKKWKWKEFSSSKSPSNTNVQINQQFHLKISNQEDVVLTFNSLSYHSKFSVGCKITEPIAPPLVQSDVSSMLHYHKKTKAEISFLLQSIVDSQRHLTTHRNKSTTVLPPLVRTKVKLSSTAKHVTF